MEQLPSEIKLQEFWRHLSYEEIHNLCQTNVEFSRICEINIMWQYLLYRDFGIVYNENNARQMYLLYKHALDFLSNFYPVITQRALKIFAENVSTTDWNNIKMVVHNRYYNPILTVTDLVLLVNFARQEAYFLSRYKQYIISEKSRDSVGYAANIRLVYPDYDQMLLELEQDRCQQFMTLVSHPTFIFVNKRLMQIGYDYDLAILFGVDSSHVNCLIQFHQLGNMILKLSGK
jgi:hypothetical protein